MIFNQRDQGAFVEFETDAWIRMAPHYESLAGRMTRQIVEPVLDAAGFGPIGIQTSTTLLDVASGPGYVAAAAYNRGALPTGVDFSADMVAMARERFPTVDFRQGDAEDLPFAAESFDAVVCSFGLLHFPRPGKAVAEAQRVLRPGGRFAFTVWCGPAKSKLFATINETLQRHIVTQVKLPPGPGAYMFSDPMVCLAAMDAARFANVTVEEVPCLFEMKDPGDIFEFMLRCGPRAVWIYERQPPDVRAAIEQALREAGQQAMATDGGRIPCPALVVSGVKKEG